MNTIIIIMLINKIITEITRIKIIITEINTKVTTTIIKIKVNKIIKVKITTTVIKHSRLKRIPMIFQMVLT